MERTGIATFLLRRGRATKWLFTRIEALARAIVHAVMAEKKGYCSAKAGNQEKTEALRRMMRFWGAGGRLHG
ncbi:MAG: hypothetical protein ABR903_08795 [Thermodesulfovibrionales bacterium]|jgi:hypothetical protein